MITSHANPQIKLIKKLRLRKERQALGIFYAEGLRIVSEAIQREQPIEFLITSPELLISTHGKQVVQTARDKGIPVLEVTKEIFKDISPKEGPQGIAAVIRSFAHKIQDISTKEGALWVALDEIQDPGNLGAILRTLDAVGGSGVVLLDQSTDAFDPTVVRASMGALFTLTIVKTSFEEFKNWIKENNLPVIGTSGNSTDEYRTHAYMLPMVLLMGSEKKGLLLKHIEICEKIVQIPMVGSVDSLNLAVATAVILYEIFHQTRER